MEQSQQDLENIKVRIIDHIKKTYDETKANEYISNIDSMSDEQFVEFLKQQGLIQGEGANSKTQCVFCSMVFGDIPTTKIGENEKGIAILELNPITEGHSLIIPKEHIESQDKLPEEVKNLTKEISEQLQKTFNPSRVDQLPGNIMGHEAINLIPIYNNETINSPRQQQTPEGLAELKQKIENSKPEQIIRNKEVEQIETPTETQEEITKENTWLPKRIP